MMNLDQDIYIFLIIFQNVKHAVARDLGGTIQTLYQVWVIYIDCGLMTDHEATCLAALVHS